jgi:hypothetical protein
MIRMSLLLVTIAAFASGPDGDFSHRKHASLKMKCTQCHMTAEKDEIASFPEVSSCRVCHTSMAEREIPSRRVYLLRQFVFFSHADHHAAKVACATCHGEVNNHDILKVERPTTMAACMTCHKETKAPLGCNACHELGH